jgi:hypothetical protein
MESEHIFIPRKEYEEQIKNFISEEKLFIGGLYTAMFRLKKDEAAKMPARVRAIKPNEEYGFRAVVFDLISRDKISRPVQAVGTFALGVSCDVGTRTHILRISTDERFEIEETYFKNYSDGDDGFMRVNAVSDKILAPA